jgi:hypothetical protein
MEALEGNQSEKWKLFNPFLNLEGKFSVTLLKNGKNQNINSKNI